MRSTLRVLLLAVIPMALGCGDDIKFPDPIPPPAPALNGVVPANGFTSRTIRVQISGDGSEWTNTASVVFNGDGITVDNVELASESSLFATITIAPTAPLGLRDVIVTDGDTTLTLDQAFDVADPIEIFTVGDVEQGGFATVLIVNRDNQNPFLGDIEVTAGAGTTFFVDADESSEFKLFATVFFDTDATTGPVVVEDALGSDLVSSRGADLTVAARTATALAPPVKSNIDLTATATLSGDSELFSFAAASALVSLDVRTTNLNASPFMVFLENGKWANARGFLDNDLIPTTANTTMFVVVIDGGVAQGYSFTVDADTVVALPSRTNLTEVEPNDDDTDAQAATGSVILFSGRFADEDDVDFIKVSATAGQTIRVNTTTGPLGDPLVDTEIAILDTDGVTLLVDFTDDDFREQIISDGVPTTGDYFVVIRPSAFCIAFECYLPANEPYEASILVQGT